MKEYIQTEINEAAEQLMCSVTSLDIWLSQTNLNDIQKIQCLHLMKKYHLDPWLEEIMTYESPTSQTSIHITMDGWYRILNQQEHFAGLSLREAECSDPNDIPAWMECTLYRDDRILPIVVREYFSEVKTEHSSWHHWPRRMLRHRVIQQATRLAFGISTLENNEPIKIKIDHGPTHPAMKGRAALHELLIHKEKNTSLCIDRKD